MECASYPRSVGQGARLQSVPTPGRLGERGVLKICYVQEGQAISVSGYPLGTPSEPYDRTAAPVTHGSLRWAPTPRLAPRMLGPERCPLSLLTPEADASAVSLPESGFHYGTC